MSIAFFSCGHGDVLDPSGTRDLEQQRCQVAMADRLAAADVEDLAVATVVRSRTQERVRRIVHVDEVAELGAVAVDLDRVVPRAPAG